MTNIVIKFIKYGNLPDFSITIIIHLKRKMGFFQELFDFTTNTTYTYI